MNSSVLSIAPGSRLIRFASLVIATALVTAPLLAQRPTTTPAKPPAQREAPPRIPDPTFETLLGADTYKLYGEVRNVGQLLSTGGAGEIVDPIIKLANPPQEFQSIVKFLKKNEEALATSRLLFASWPALADVPDAFVAIEFATPEEAAKFSPKLEKFLPTVLPPVPIEPEPKPATPPQATPTGPGKQAMAEPEKSKDGQKAEIQTGKQTQSEPKKETAPGSNPKPSPQEHQPFVISHRGNLVFISDKSFKFEKLHPASSKALAEDQNFRIAHDRFSSESIFLYFNVGLEDRSKPKASAGPFVTEQEAERSRLKDTDAALDQTPAKPPSDPSMPQPSTVQETPNEPRAVVLFGSPQSTPEPTPTPTKQRQAQMVASSQLGQMRDLLGIGEPQWPEAVGVALVLDNNEYVVRAILIEPPERRKLPLPFVPQLVSGPAHTAEAPQVLPDDTEVFVSVSIDLAQTYEGMRKQAEIKAKADPGPRSGTLENGVLVAYPREPFQDPFAEFEKKAGFKIKDDLLSALGSEIAVAGSLKTLESAGFFGPPPAPKPSPSPGDAKSDQEQKGSDVFPMLLIAVKDRDAARRLMPHVLDGLGMGEANMIAQVEKHDDAEIVNYAGMFAYAFVGNFLIISEAATVRRAVNAWTNRQTLASNNAFRNFTRWQSRQTLGQIYVSPALMDSYREQLKKQAPKMDTALRDLLMSLSPAPQAISYSLSNEGFGQLHELHLPKDLVIAMVANTSATMSAFKEGSPETNEMIAISLLRMIGNAEASYRATTGNGNYGSLDELVNQHLVQKEMLGDEFQKKYGYRLGVVVAGDDFQATATPIEYGKTGNRSFFVDKSGVVRGDDHGGGLATVADKPVLQP